jgi:uracil phosphoribosyltransferase
MKESLITILRDRHTTMGEFKRASSKLSKIIAAEIACTIEEESMSVHSPHKEVMGKKVSQDVILVPILRAGMALLPSFMTFFENARVGFIGIHRDKEAHPHLYYEKIPLLTKNDRIIILDPMIATGGSTRLTLQKLTEAGGAAEKCTVVGMVGAPEGIESINKAYPKTHVIVAATDEGLDEKKYIVPGLGDFGDRFFGC